ncbi:MAG: hypothetical protein ABI651_01910 [Verrucomicrobiota bacterium]
MIHNSCFMGYVRNHQWSDFTQCGAAAQPAFSEEGTNTDTAEAGNDTKAGPKFS